MTEEKKVKVRIAYSLDKDEVGTVKEVTKSEAQSLIGEGRAHKVDDNGERVYDQPRDERDEPAGPGGNPVVTLPRPQAEAPQPASGPVDGSAAAAPAAKVNPPR